MYHRTRRTDKALCTSACTWHVSTIFCIIRDNQSWRSHHQCSRCCVQEAIMIIFLAALKISILYYSETIPDEAVSAIIVINSWRAKKTASINCHVRHSSIPVNLIFTADFLKKNIMRTAIETDYNTVQTAEERIIIKSLRQHYKYNTTCCAYL